jgi:hypothetical protein
MVIDPGFHISLEVLGRCGNQKILSHDELMKGNGVDKVLNTFLKLTVNPSKSMKLRNKTHQKYRSIIILIISD